MISHPEFTANAKQLDDLGRTHTDDLNIRLAGVSNLKDAVKVTNSIADNYHSDFEDLLSTALAESGNRTVDHYDKVLGLNLSDEDKHAIVADAIMKQPVEPYYGATLDQRLQGSRALNRARIKRSAFTGQTLEVRKRNLIRIFLESYPWGAQVPHDKRIMLSQCVKLEHDIANIMAGKADVKIVKWTLSHRHKVKDICDELAENVDKRVLDYFEEHNIRLDPKGCYFLEDTPQLPHPNCRCSLRMLRGKTFTTSLVERAVEAIKDLLGRFRRKGTTLH